MVFGVDPDVLVHGGVSYDTLICPEDRERVQREVLSTLMPLGTFTAEYRILHADGQRRTVREQSRAARDSQGKIIAWEGFVYEITAQVDHACVRNERDAQLQHAKNLKSINLLARGIAHDFNNMIAGILSSAELIKMDSIPGNTSDEFLDQIFATGGRARQMINELREFSLREPCAPALIPLQPIVVECLQLLRSIVREKVEVTQEIDLNCPGVFADACQLHQAIMKLANNSRNSLPEHEGRIDVRLDQCEIKLDAALPHAGLRAGRFVRISIRDNGRGLNDGAMKRVFEPFAMKFVGGKNSGLDLFLVQEIANAHDGAVTVESTPGKGTEYHLYLPIPAQVAPVGRSALGV